MSQREWDLRLMGSAEKSIDASGVFCEGDHGFSGGKDAAFDEAKRRAALFISSCGGDDKLRFYCVDRSMRLVISFDRRALTDETPNG